MNGHHVKTHVCIVAFAAVHPFKYTVNVIGRALGVVQKQHHTHSEGRGILNFVTISDEGRGFLESVMAHICILKSNVRN